MSPTARRNLVLWAVILAALSAEWWLFAGDVHRRVDWAYPRFWDQVTTLQVAYESYEQSRALGLPLALRNLAHRDHPMGLLLPAADLLAFTVAGPSRLHALAPVFAAYALMQVVLVVVLRRLAGIGAALLGYGLSLAMGALYQGAGGLEDVRADLPAACLFAVFLGLALRAGVFRSARGSALAGLAAAACGATRFVAIVHLGALLAAFAAVEAALWHRARDAGARRDAAARLRGASIAGALLLALNAPLLWLQRDGIGAHYLRGIMGPLRAARAEVVGASQPLGNLAFYPRTLLGQIGPTWIAVGLLLAGLVGYELALGARRGPGPAARLLALAFAAPLAILTAVTSKSPVVGVMLTAPLLWALPLAADRWRRQRSARGIATAEASLLAVAAVVTFLGARVQHRNRRVYSTPLVRAEVSGVFALFDALARDANARGTRRPIVSVDHVSDHLHGWTQNVSAYERTGRLLPARLGLGAGIAAISEADAVAQARESDYLIVTLAEHEPPGAYPADRALGAARPALLALAERAMRPLGRFRTPGREVALYGRPESDLLPVLPADGAGSARADAFLRDQRSATIEATGLTREAYLDVVLGQVRAFRRYQAEDGTIVDPVEHREWQYATPCYAAAVAALAHAGRADADLLESGLRAMDASVAAIAAYRPADSHGDFFTYPVMTAYGLYRGQAPPERTRRWTRALVGIDPYRLYRNTLGQGREPLYNWNLVASAGEFLRADAGLAPDLRFVERHVPWHVPHFDAAGLYRDPGLPLAYDAFARYHLTSILAAGYRGAAHAELRHRLWAGAWTSLFMMSAAGESPTGGRSAHHVWNEAQAAALFETYATAYARSGRPAEAGAFKRAARLSLASIRRWVRPDGSLFVVKNRYPVEARHGYEKYSSHSQYNLLAATMLAAAYRAADDTIQERPSPADVGGFVLVMPEFHKVFAGTGGTLVECDTFGDPQYNPTGLLRVHMAGGNPQLGPSDGVRAPGLRALGTAWKDAAGAWQRLGGAHVATRVEVVEETVKRVRFRIVYEGMSGGLTRYEQAITVAPAAVTIEDRVDGPHQGLRVEVPALVEDGLERTAVAISGRSVRLSLRGGTNQVTLVSPDGAFRRTGETFDHRNGVVETIAAEVAGDRAVYRVVALPTGVRATEDR
jgi:hypothetical protein